MDQLVNHYREFALPDIFFKDEPERISDDEPRKSWSTQETSDGYLRVDLTSLRLAPFIRGQISSCRKLAKEPKFRKW